MSYARGQIPKSVILRDHPHLAEVDAALARGLDLDRWFRANVPDGAYARWPSETALTIACAFSREADADRFAKAFGGRRLPRPAMGRPAVAERKPTDAEIDAVLAEFGGDAREAVRALLRDLAVLAADYEADVSHGCVRGEPPTIRRRAAQNV